jgi:large subunit ribosomal protein L17
MPTFKLSRTKQHRDRTLRNLVTSIVLYESVTTTVAKAQAVRPMVERLITHTRTGTLAARRYAKSLLFDPNAVTKLFEDIPPRLGERTSGFVRLTKLPPRSGDGSAMARIELILTPLETLLAQESKTQVRTRKAARKTASQSEETTKPEPADTPVEKSQGTETTEESNA